MRCLRILTRYIVYFYENYIGFYIIDNAMKYSNLPVVLEYLHNI